MGSFRLVAGNRHLHRYYNFAGRVVETVPDRYTIRAGQNLPDKEFRYLRTVIVTAAVYRGFNSMLSHLLLTFRHRAGVSPYTSSFDLAETCVFAKQSPGPILCDLISQVPLIPKLRGQLAEFLNNPSPVGLRIFFLSTVSVCGTGALYIHTAFLVSVHCDFPTNFRSLSTGSTIARLHNFQSVPVLKYFCGYGISTVCASATRFRLTLAPGLP